MSRIADGEYRDNRSVPGQRIQTSGTIGAEPVYKLQIVTLRSVMEEGVSQSFVHKGDSAGSRSQDTRGNIGADSGDHIRIRVGMKQHLGRELIKCGFLYDRAKAYNHGSIEDNCNLGKGCRV